MTYNRIIAMSSLLLGLSLLSGNNNKSTIRSGDLKSSRIDRNGSNRFEAIGNNTIR